MELEKLLHQKVAYYNNKSFIKDDPICVPHRFTKKQDIEIAGFFAAIFACGQRVTIINKATELMQLMDNAPYNFIMQDDFENELDEICSYSNFKHRTFNEMDLYHLLHFLRFHYWFLGEESLETAFVKKYNFDYENPKLESIENISVEIALTNFYKYVFGYDEEANDEKHCRKHIASPTTKSACKRLNMYLRWMVRKDAAGVDFGLWTNITTKDLICPLDVHVGNVARQLGLLQSPKNDWAAAIELTENLKKFDVYDPVQYDFALFSMGVIEGKM